VRGVVLALGLGLVAQHLQPSGLGHHVAVALFLAAYAWEERSVFWKYSLPVLLGYAGYVSFGLGGGGELLPHATAGLVAWLLVKLFGEAVREEDRPEPEQTGLGLGL
jgi:hypothetical protein